MTLNAIQQPHRIERVRYEIKRRLLVVKRKIHVTPHMIRVTLTGAELSGFSSLGHDDHIKLFIPEAGKAFRFPELGPDGRLLDDPANRPVMRDYTPRRFDPETLELDLDFAVHDAGPATQWAEGAKEGDLIGIAGPRGSFVIADAFDWYLLVGDETALPAIGRWVEHLPASARVHVVAEVENAAEEQRFQTAADMTCTWLHRGEAAAGSTRNLDLALRGMEALPGEGYCWIACETLVAKRLRAIMMDERGHAKAWIKASGYWKRGQADFHESHDDERSDALRRGG